MPTFLIFAVVLAVMAAVSVAVSRAEKKRGTALSATAARLGWNYRDAVPFETIPDLDRFELFAQGRDRTLSNVMTSLAGETRAVLFDYKYEVGSGKSRSTTRQTVLYMVNDALDLPMFSLRPQRFFHGIAKAFGYRDIDLEGRPVFSGMFLLRGEDEARVRAAFGDSVAAFFEAHAHVCTAAIGREVLYRRPGRRVDPDRLESFIAEGMELPQRFVKEVPR